LKCPGLIRTQGVTETDMLIFNEDPSFNFKPHVISTVDSLDEMSRGHNDIRSEVSWT